VGEVAKTRAPLPVSSVIAAAKFAEDGVPKNVATFVPKPDTPVLMGRPVAFVKDAAVVERIVPFPVGKVSVVVPATFGALNVIAPLVSPLTTMLAIFFSFNATFLNFLLLKLKF
jgi:hypothetical protein